eukprot:c20237_g1_i1 orf=334-3666(-)
MELRDSLPHTPKKKRNSKLTTHTEEEEDDEEDEREEAEEDEGEEREEEENEDVERVEIEEDDEGEKEGRRRYALRNRTEIQRFSPRVDERPLHSRPSSRPFQFRSAIKRSRENRRIHSRQDQRPRISRADDSDDSLLIDEMVDMPGAPWFKGGSSCANSCPCSGLDLSGFSNRGLNIAGTGWGHQADCWGAAPSDTGIQKGLGHKSGADITPVQVDDSIGFNEVGGLSGYIRSLKEMVYFPLLYPKFFENYGITPPRGVLLCGPPGTGKTLIVRALASSVARAGQRINFYMRKGADILSKWVGEAERQLRMLFEEAQRNQPSIIFFDEIDGLAPVRSSKQEQIHNSIVSTLLALMDGLDARGQVIVIGATNRVDAIDGALRRPGRFDRELVFSLPDCKARAEILDIHTRNWQDRPSEELLKELAAACVGYCGADLKALCTEATIRAFRKKYPQVYTSDEQLVIDINEVKIGRRDFLEAMSTITPAAQRGALVQSMPLSSIVLPCLSGQLKMIMDRIAVIFPLGYTDVGLFIPVEDGSANQLASFSTLRYGSSFPFVYRPKLLLCGKEENGLESLGPAVLHELERFPIHCLALPSLLSDLNSRTPEEALVNILSEARRTAPAILYLPRLDLWWETAHAMLRAVLLMLLAELPSNLPILLLGTAQVPPNELDEQVAKLFKGHVYELGQPSAEDRENFFSHLIDTVLAIPGNKHNQEAKLEALPELPKAPKKERRPSEAELQAQAEEELHALRRLRMCLRDVCNRLLCEKCFSVFHYPVMEEDAPNYNAVIQTPMDVVTLLQRVDNGHYLTLSAFLQDLELIPSNAEVYHGDDYSGARIVSKAYALRDAAHGMLSQIDEHLVARCDEIATQRRLLKVGREETVSTPKAVMDQPLHTTVDCSYLGGSWPKLTKSQMCEVDPEHSKCIRVGKNEGESETVASGHEHVTTTSKSENYSAVPTKETAAASCVFPKTIQHEIAQMGGVEYPIGNAAAKRKKKPTLTHNSDATGVSFVPNCGTNGMESMLHTNQINKNNGNLCPQHKKYSAYFLKKIRRRFVKCSKGYGISEFERLHACVSQKLRDLPGPINRDDAMKCIEEMVEEVELALCQKSYKNT